MGLVVPVTLVALAGCAPKPPTAEQLAAERRAVTDVLRLLWASSAAKDSAGILRTLPDSGEWVVFGTDSAEVIRSKAEALAQCRAEFQARGADSMSVGEFRNLHIMVASSGDVASAAGEVPIDVVAGGQSRHTLGRFGMGLRKDDGRWKIVHTVVAVATTGQSSPEQAARRQTKR